MKLIIAVLLLSAQLQGIRGGREGGGYVLRSRPLPLEACVRTMSMGRSSM